MNAIEAGNVNFTYKSGFIKRSHILKGLNFTVKKGEIYGFLGPNGAGKTTTIKLLNNFMKRNSGDLNIFNVDAEDIKARESVGYMPENPGFYAYLSGTEFLRFVARLKGIAGQVRENNITALIKLVGLEKYGNLQVGKYSKGMAQRLGLAQALVGDPPLLIFDEPIANLDPLGRRLFRDIFLRLKDEGKTIFFSTHIIPDVEMICDRVGILINGTIVKEGGLDVMLSGHTEYTEVVVKGSDIGDVVNAFKADILGVITRDNTAIIKFTGQTAVDRALKKIVESDLRVISVMPHSESLEDIFIHEIDHV